MKQEDGCLGFILLEMIAMEAVAMYLKIRVE
jgi:hypothetical protein